ncbi:hypothetical protein [Mixta calida]|uniref:hypothetical protein n=1 Tax=Mixta calida TaxID=665913 RepID=UPI00289C9461|nr:hypothetical protein [Mixta calida]
MNNQELAALCRIEIRRWQSVPDKRYMVDLLELALAALTAEQAAQTESDDYCNLKELYHAQEKRLFKLAQRIKGPAFDKYAHTTAQAIDVLEASLIDNTAQQYEALGKGHKC